MSTNPYPDAAGGRPPQLPPPPPTPDMQLGVPPIDPSGYTDASHQTRTSGGHFEDTPSAGEGRVVVLFFAIVLVVIALLAWASF